MELTAKQLAETYAEAARQNYTKDGHLTPIVHVLDAKGAGISMVPNTDRFGGQPREQLSALVLLSADAIETVFIAVCVEAWMKGFGPDATPESTNLERGQLTREAETDPAIHTSLVVHVIDVRDASHSHNVMSTVVGDPRVHTYDIHSQEGVMDGAMVEMLLNAYNGACLGIAPLPDEARGSVLKRVQFLGDVDFIAAALMTVESDG